MQYKSVRSSSKVWFKKSISQTALSLAALTLSAALFAQSGWAMTITPVKQDNTSLTNMDATGTAYYPSSTATSPLDSSDDAVPLVVPTTNQATDTSGAQAMLFNVSATTASYSPPSGGTGTYNVFIMGFVKSNSDNNYYPIPLAFFNPIPATTNSFSSCQNNNCFLKGYNYTGLPPANTTYYFAVPFTPNTTVTVGIYPSDICYLYGGTQLTATGAGAPCTNSSGTNTYLPIAGQSQGFQIKFTVVLIPTDVVTQIAPQSTNDTNLGQISPTSDTGTLFLSFLPSGGSINTASCPAQNTLYQPGDQSIYLDTTGFQNIYVGPSLTGTGRIAPVSSILMTYKTSPTLNGAPSATTFSDPVFARGIPFGNSSQLVTGFKNSTDQSQTYYNFSIFMRDAAGFVTAPAGGYGASCSLNNVATAEIEAFLKQSKCFIATAAFRSMDAAPVAMLRQFRDQVLLNFGLGQGFVHWYYRWSPPAAEWLIQHPEFRYPVLLALVPVEIIAWLCLRPLIFLSLACAGLLLFVALRKRLNPRMSGESA